MCNWNIACCMEWLTDLHFCFNRKLIPINPIFLLAGNQAWIFIFIDYRVVLTSFYNEHRPIIIIIIIIVIIIIIIIIIIINPALSIILIIKHNHNHNDNHKSISIINCSHQSFSSSIIIIINHHYHHQSSSIIINHHQSSSSSSSSSKLCFGQHCYTYRRL